MTDHSISDYSEEEDDEEWDAEEEDDEEWDAEEEDVEEEQIVPPRHAAPAAAVYRSTCSCTSAKTAANRYHVPPEYDLRAPTATQRAHAPPPGYATIYTCHFRHGLRLPLPPFVVSLLANYEIALAQLHPSSIVTLLGFLDICRRASIVPTTTLFRNFFRLGKTINMKEGWYTFLQKVPNVGHGQDISVSGWKNAFLFFKTSHMPEKVISSWNYASISDPPLSRDEVLPEKTISWFLACASKYKWTVLHRIPHEFEDGSMDTVPVSRSSKKKAATESLSNKSSKDPTSIPSAKAMNPKSVSIKPPNAEGTYDSEDGSMDTVPVSRSSKKKAATESHANKSSKENDPTSIPSAKTMNPKSVSTKPPNAACKLKRMAEFDATKPAKALRGPSGKKRVDGSSQVPSVPSFQDMTLDQFAAYNQKCWRSFSLQLQGDKKKLEKVVDSLKTEVSKLQGVKEHNLKDSEKEIAALKEDKERLQKENALLQEDKEKLQLKNALLQGDRVELEKENASLKGEVSRLQSPSDDHGPLLNVLGKVVAAMEQEVKDKNEEIGLLKSRLKSVEVKKEPAMAHGVIL